MYNANNIFACDLKGNWSLMENIVQAAAQPRKVRAFWNLYGIVVQCEAIYSLLHLK